MAVYVALIRAINVGGTSKLLMADLRALCAAAGFDDPKTYIQTGNVLLTTELTEAALKEALGSALEAKMGKPMDVIVRSRAEVETTLERNPFADAAGNRLYVYFLDEPPAPDALDDVTITGTEEVRVAGREVFVHYPDGMGRSRLKLPFAEVGTARNLNTVRKLAELAAEREGSQ